MPNGDLWQPMSMDHRISSIGLRILIFQIILIGISSMTSIFTDLWKIEISHGKPHKHSDFQ